MLQNNIGNLTIVRKEAPYKAITISVNADNVLDEKKNIYGD